MKQPKGYVLYEGPSQLDPAVIIICILTLRSRNEKTGDMAQTWIMRKDMSPLQALYQDKDEPICGSCIHRLKRTCYVNVAFAPRGIFVAYEKGLYPQANPVALRHVLAGRSLRLGAYGDPAAVPISVWHGLVPHARKITGYTHMWSQFPDLNQYCMASVETLAERAAAKTLGFRTFRVKSDSEERIKPAEAQCPASREGGYQLSCDTCGACNGRQTTLKGDIAINVHGLRTHRFLQEKLF